MTRIDMTTQEWHDLIVPVLPHASDDADLPPLGHIRVEAARQVLYAVASDRYTLGVSRHVLGEAPGDTAIHIDRRDAKDMLKLFRYSKTEDPQLKIVIDKVRIATGRDDLTGVGLGLTIESEMGTRVTLNDVRDHLTDHPLVSWRKTIAGVVFRDLEPASPSLLLSPEFMARWSAACRHPGERVKFFAGPGATDPILMLVEDNFAGVWQPVGHLDAGSPELLNGSPWRAETRNRDDETEAA